MLIGKIACNVGGGPENCQLNIVDLEGTLTNINIYCLSTVGTVNMISEDGKSLALYSDNVNVFPDNIAMFRLAAGSGGSGPVPTMTAIPTTLVPASSVPASSTPTTLSHPPSIPTSSFTSWRFPTTWTLPPLVSTTSATLSQFPTTLQTQASTSKSPVKPSTSVFPPSLKSYPPTPKPSAPSTSTSTFISSSWKSLGCYTDDNGGRAMKGYPVPGGPQAMTIEICQSTCSGLGYVLAGLEYADECCKSTEQN